jgi:hypothetical protein
MISIKAESLGAILKFQRYHPTALGIFPWFCLNCSLISVRLISQSTHLCASSFRKMRSIFSEKIIIALRTVRTGFSKRGSVKHWKQTTQRAKLANVQRNDPPISYVSIYQFRFQFSGTTSRV